MTTNTRGSGGTNRAPTGRWMAIVALFVVAVALLVAGSGGATAQTATPTNISDVAPYYANESADVANESWYAGVENGTLDEMGKMATRFLSFYIGYGEMAPDEAGFEGILLTGIIMIAMFVGAVFMLPIGTVGGGVFAVIVGYGMTDMGLAPSWFRAVLLMIVGLLCFVAFRQALQAR